MDRLLLTGFPGFLGSALLPRLLGAPPRRCRRLPGAGRTPRRRRGSACATWGASTRDCQDRIELVDGDITEPGLGLDAETRGRPRGDVTEVWHLAAVYDLAASRGPGSPGQRGRDGARPRRCAGSLAAAGAAAPRQHLLRQRPVRRGVPRGRPRGRPALPQPLRVDEVRSRAAGPRGDGQGSAGDDLPARDRRRRLGTGETQKYDGPYFLARFLARQPGPVAVVPRVGDPDTVRVCLVPRDFVVDAMDALSVLPASVGRTYALTDPAPPTVRQVVDAFSARLGKKVVWVPLPLSPDACPDRPGARPGAAARPARRGRRLLRLADDLLDGQHHGRPRRHRGVAALRSPTTPTGWSTSWPGTPTSGRRRWSEVARAADRRPHRRRRQPDRPRARPRQGGHLPGSHLPARAGRDLG